MITFFLSQFATHRDLHSFPTRRSSDLFVLTGVVRSGIDCSVLQGARVEFWLRRPDGQDRKSTRLNSSHEWISYAVFCLKKKKNTFLRFCWLWLVAAKDD